MSTLIRPFAVNADLAQTLKDFRTPALSRVVELNVFTLPGTILTCAEIFPRMSAFLKGFRMPARQTRGGARRQASEKPRRRKPRGEFAPTLVSVYGEFVAAG